MPDLRLADWIRSVKVRSVDDVRSPRLRAVVATQVAHRAAGTG